MQKQLKDLAKLDLFRSRNRVISILLTGPIDIPYFHDGMASNSAWTPLDITNPDEWKDSFSAYICFDLSKGENFILAESDYVEKYSGDVTEGYIPYDHGTSNLRLSLGLVKLADKWYGKSSAETLDRWLKGYKE